MEIDKLEYLVHLACLSAHCFGRSPAALVYLWAPNRSLPQAESCVDGMLHCLFSVQAHCLLSRVFVYSVCLCLVLA